MPKLALAGLAGKPRVATSQLLSGTGKAEEDRVLDGIAFPTEPWTSGGYVAGLAPEASVAQALPTARGGAARLFAFGYDARSEEHTSELPSIMRNSYAVFCLKKKKIKYTTTNTIKCNTVTKCT